MGQGYASKSNVEALRETLQIGCSIQGTAHLVSHLADNIRVPDFIEDLDREISSLSQECKVALRLRYICRGNIFLFSSKKMYVFWLKRAERQLL